MCYKIVVSVICVLVLVNSQATSAGNDNSNENTELIEDNTFVDANNDTVSARFATTCDTPNNEPGYCLEVAKCSIFAKLDMTPSHPSYDFFKASNCSAKNAKIMKVCCGKLDNFKSQINKNQQKPEIEEFNPLPKDCGTQKMLTLNKRILGGTNASLGEFPWMARLIHRDRAGFSEYGCSAFLIHQSFAVTAAHCVNKNLLKLIGNIHEIVLGDHDSSTAIDCTGKTKIKCALPPQIIRVRPNPTVYSGYNTSTGNFNNDIALIHLKTPAEFTNFVRPICLMEQKSTTGVYTLSGWGKTETVEASTVKLKVILDRFPIADCMKVYRNHGVSLNKKNQMCAGGKENIDSCTGDSGGPLMIEDNFIWYAEGIVSFGIGCGAKGMPGVYTHIPTYVPWIKKTITRKLTQARNKKIKTKKIIE